MYSNKWFRIVFAFKYHSKIRNRHLKTRVLLKISLNIRQQGLARLQCMQLTNLTLPQNFFLVTKNWSSFFTKEIRKSYCIKVSTQILLLWLIYFLKLTCVCCEKGWEGRKRLFTILNPNRYYIIDYPLDMGTNVR